MKIVVLDGYATNPGDLSWEGIAAAGELTVYDRTSPEELPKRIEGADILITNKTYLSAKTIQGCPKLRYIGLLSTGTNAADLAAARERGIPVCNIPAYSTDEVAQHTLALLLEITNQVGLHSAGVQAGEWARSPEFCYFRTPLMALAGKTFGCIGFGAIGQQTGRLAAAFKMRVLACGSRETEAGRAIAAYVTQDDLLRQADIISLHCPLNAETKGLIGPENLAKMKDGVILLNTARGPLVNEQALADALASGKVYAAGLDVVAREPMDENSPLLGAKNCFITPHNAWLPLDARRRLMDTAVANLQGFLNGQPQNVVN